jgi:hypothetical protein
MGVWPAGYGAMPGGYGAMPGMPGMQGIPGMAGMQGMPGMIPSPYYNANPMAPIYYGFNPYEMDQN